MPSISGMAEIISQLESPYITVAQDRCVLVRNRNAGCLRCAEVCTSGCISFDGERLSVSPEECIGCGTCATACPGGALIAHHPDDESLLAACRTSFELLGESVCIACGRMLDRAYGLYDAEKAVRVECLGRVEETLLTTLLQLGVPAVTLVHGACGDCEHATGRCMLEGVLESERELLDAWNQGMEMRVSSRLPGAVRAVDEGYDKSKCSRKRAGRACVPELLRLKSPPATRWAPNGCPAKTRPGARMRRWPKTGPFPIPCRLAGCVCSMCFRLLTSHKTL